MDINAYRLIYENRPDTANYNLQTNDGRIAYNKAIDDFYKSNNLANPGLIICDIFHGLIKYKASDFTMKTNNINPNKNEDKETHTKIKNRTPLDGKYDATGNYIGPFKRDWKDIPFVKREGWKDFLNKSKC